MCYKSTNESYSCFTIVWNFDQFTLSVHSIYTAQATYSTVTHIVSKSHEKLLTCSVVIATVSSCLYDIVKALTARHCKQSCSPCLMFTHTAKKLPIIYKQIYLYTTLSD